MGGVALDAGERAEGRHLLDEALDIQRRSGDLWGLAVSLAIRADMAREEGNLGDARALAEEGLAVAQELGARDTLAALWMKLGNVSLDAGDLIHARACYTESLMLWRDVGDREPDRRSPGLFRRAGCCPPTAPAGSPIGGGCRRSGWGARFPPTRAGLARGVGGACPARSADAARAAAVAHAWAEGTVAWPGAPRMPSWSPPL